MAAPSTAGVTDLDGLSDVTLTAKATGDMLRYNGSGSGQHAGALGTGHRWRRYLRLGWR